MAVHVERWMIPYLTGKCFDYALALADHLADPVFVAVGSPTHPDHVGLKFGDRYVDARGILSAGDFVNLDPKGQGALGLTACEAERCITEIDRETVELHAGLAYVDADGERMAYEDSEDFCRAAEDVETALSGGRLDGLGEIAAAGGLSA